MKNASLAMAIVLSVGFFVGPIGAGEAKKTKRKKKQTRPQIEVCFVLDTTGSMSGMIQGAKDKIWSIANEMMSTKPVPKIKFGLVAYRDRGDTYVTQQYELTDDIDEIHTKLMAFKAMGGGDGPESVNQALREAVEDMKWSKNRKILKMLFLVGDAPPHMDYNETQYPDVCKLALEKDLIINTVQCGTMNGTREIWQDIAYSGQGQYSAILQNGGTVAVKTPFDGDIAKLNGQLNRTICVYGDNEMQLMAQSKISSQSAAKAESVADRASYFQKGRDASEMSGGGAAMGSANCVISGTDDLVEMIMDKKVSLKDIDEEKLPDDLKKLTKAERETELNKRVEARKKSQIMMAELVKKRSAYIKQQKEKDAKAAPAASFDVQIKNIIREQASKKGIHYTEE